VELRPGRSRPKKRLQFKGEKEGTVSSNHADCGHSRKRGGERERGGVSRVLSGGGEEFGERTNDWGGTSRIRGRENGWDGG